MGQELRWGTTVRVTPHTCSNLCTPDRTRMHTQHVPTCVPRGPGLCLGTAEVWVPGWAKGEAEFPQAAQSWAGVSLGIVPRALQGSLVHVSAQESGTDQIS